MGNCIIVVFFFNYSKPISENNHIAIQRILIISLLQCDQTWLILGVFWRKKLRPNHFAIFKKNAPKRRIFAQSGTDVMILKIF
jgi:hypothetical protein